MRIGTIRENLQVEGKEAEDQERLKMVRRKALAEGEMSEKRVGETGRVRAGGSREGREGWSSSARSKEEQRPEGWEQEGEREDTR